MDEIQVLKVGGKLFADQVAYERFLGQFVAIAGPKILVHGGGKQAGELAGRLGVPIRVHKGRRLTDAATLDVVVMAYAGQLNTQLVADLAQRGCNALGLNGASGGVMLSRKRAVRDIDYGFAGDIQSVNVNRLLELVKAGFVPVISPITCDNNAQLLNTNADTMAATIASALAKEETDLILGQTEVALRLCFDFAGVLPALKPGAEPLQVLRKQEYEEMKSQERVHSGMLPKLDNAFSAKVAGVSRVEVGSWDLEESPTKIAL